MIAIFTRSRRYSWDAYAAPLRRGPNASGGVLRRLTVEACDHFRSQHDKPLGRPFASAKHVAFPWYSEVGGELTTRKNGGLASGSRPAPPPEQCQGSRAVRTGEQLLGLVQHRIKRRRAVVALPAMEVVLEEVADNCIAAIPRSKRIGYRLLCG